MAKGASDNLTLEDIYALREGCEVECKKAAGKDGQGALPNDFWPTYSAFANTEGGEIFLGLQENEDGSYEVTGIKKVEKVTQDLLNLLNNKSKVSVNVLAADSVRVHTINGMNVIQVSVPRASRKQRPVYIDKNPLIGTFIRRGEGDFTLDEVSVKKLLAEQRDGSCDEKILQGYTIEEDLDAETIKAFRNTFAALKPDHPFLKQDTQEFLRSIGAWKKDRETGLSGITLAGLLMFGKLRSILDEVPFYILDYQERPALKDEPRWIDRITTDGSWSGNLYDFYNRVYPKLIADLKVPFMLKGGTRQEDTPVHEALREAFVNTLIHADFTGHVSVAIIKYPEVFGFRNPGLMRVPADLALRGGDSDCRNRNLQKMFQLIGAAEQAGSGIPKIYQSWSQQHWKKPKIIERVEPEQTIFELHRSSLLPVEVLEALSSQFGEKFHDLGQLERTILVAAATEDSLDHKRVREISAAHPADISKALAVLVRDGFLHSHGLGRGTNYYITGGELDNLIGSPELPFLGSSLMEQSSSTLASSSLGLAPNSLGLAPNSLGLAPNSLGLAPNSLGLASQLMQGAQIAQKELELSAPAKANKKLNKNSMETIILSLCALRAQPIDKLARLLDRNPDFLRNSYLNPLIRNKKMRLTYPDIKNHPNQAYESVPPPE